MPMGKSITIQTNLKGEKSVEDKYKLPLNKFNKGWGATTVKFY